MPDELDVSAQHSADRLEDELLKLVQGGRYREGVPISLRNLTFGERPPYPIPYTCEISSVSGLTYDERTLSLLIDTALPLGDEYLVSDPVLWMDREAGTVYALFQVESVDATEAAEMAIAWFTEILKRASIHPKGVIGKVDVVEPTPACWGGFDCESDCPHCL